MSRASTPTLLSIDRYARILGINPVHFNGAAGTDLFPLRGSCSDVWWQHSYIGSDRVAREDLALAIANAEEDIAKVIGYWPAPKWMAGEMHMFPRHYRQEIFDGGWQPRGDDKSLKLGWGRFISPGRRYTGLISEASIAAGTLVWSDPDGDTFDERATITLPTTLTDTSRQQVKVYHDGHTEQEWEIRDPRSITIVAGVLTIEFDFWQLIDPAQQDRYPSDTNTALNIATPTIYVDTVDVYREYTDYSQHSAEFFWEPRMVAFPCTSCGGSGCLACTTAVQCGCLHVRDVMLGIGVPEPATWDATSGAWAGATYDQCMPPDQVKVWYYAGELSDRYLRRLDLDPLSRWWAETIAWLATARLERNFCACSNLTALANELRADMSRTDANGPSWFMTEKQADNPFGTRKGEMWAWRRVSKLASIIPKVAVI